MDAKLEVTNLITPLINSYKILSDEWKNLFDKGVSEYLYSQTTKYYLTNTFIHRGDKVRFYDIYYPIKASYKANVTDFENLADIFIEYGKLTIIGSAGSGKTTLIKHIFLQTIKTTKKIPILIELRNLNDFNGGFEQLICDKAINSNLKPTDAIFKRALKSGNFLFLLDGYDEIFSNRKQELNRQIDEFIDRYSNNNFIITTRPGSGIEGFPRFYDFKVEHLTNQDVEGFTVKIVDDTERSDRIIKIIKDPKNNNYIEFLRNPLLLSMFIMAFENHPEIPKKKSSFYRNVFDTLYSRHDGVTKGSWPREKQTKLERDDFEKILDVFSFITLSEGQYTFTEEYLTDSLIKVKNTTDYNFNTAKLIYDLRTTISIMILDGFEYSFPHRSLQEYFTAHFISNLPTEKKSKAYNNLFKVLEDSSTDHSFNLWNMCYELDFIDFNVNFLIPQLKKYESQFQNKSDEQLYKVFFDNIYPIMVLDTNNPIHRGNRRVRILRHTTFFCSIMLFCDILDYSTIADFPWESGASDEIIRLYHNTVSKGGIPKFEEDLIYNPVVVELFLKYQIMDRIKKNVNAISVKIKMLEMEISKKKSNIDDILNL